MGTVKKGHSGFIKEHDWDSYLKELQEWVKRDDAWNLMGFFAEKMIAPQSFHRWLDEQPKEVREQFEAAKNYLGCKREKLLSKNILHPKAYQSTSRVYDYYADQKHKQEIREREIARAEAMVKNIAEIDELDQIIQSKKNGKKS